MRDYQPIRGRDIDGSHRSSPDVRLSAAEERRCRDQKGVCINGGKHGPATHGKRCKRCAAVHRYGLAVVLELGVDALDLSDRRVNNRFVSLL